MKITVLYLNIIFCVLLSGSLMGQERQLKFDHSKSNSDFDFISSEFLRSRPEAAVFYPSDADDCSNTVSAFGIQDEWGFFAGTNGYEDYEKAQTLTFEDSDMYSVIGGIVFFAPASVVNDGEVFAHVYSRNGDGSVGDLVATSNPLKVSELVPPSDSAVEPTFFIFAGEEIKEINTSQFILSIDFQQLYETGDTVGLYTTQEACGDGTDSYEQWGDNSWSTMFDAWGGVNLDILIGAVVQFSDATSVNEYIAHKGIQLYPAFPNPSRESIQIKYGLDDYSKTRIDIYTLSGKKIHSIENNNHAPGLHYINLDISQYPSGAYLYQITTNRGTIASKFSKN